MEERLKGRGRGWRRDCCLEGEKAGFGGNKTNHSVRETCKS